MEMLELITPTMQHKNQAEAYKKEFFDFGETVIDGSALLDQMSYENWLVNTLNNSHPETVQKDWVVASTFFVIRKSDHEIIGMLNIRHSVVASIRTIERCGGIRTEEKIYLDNKPMYIYWITI